MWCNRCKKEVIETEGECPVCGTQAAPPEEVKAVEKVKEVKPVAEPREVKPVAEVKEARIVKKRKW
jgi:hypothetical protein